MDIDLVDILLEDTLLEVVVHNMVDILLEDRLLADTLV